MDTITITILEDGTIKTETDKVSMPNHGSAEAFLRETFQMAGGSMRREFKHRHIHEAAHTHETQNGGHAH